MFDKRKLFIERNVNSLTSRNKVLDSNAVLMNTIVSSEIAINYLVQLKELVKSNAADLSVNKMLILGAEFETITDYIKSIMHELDP